jgi:transposase
MVSKRHGVPTNRIYAWRGDVRFKPDGTAVDAFTAVEVSDVVAAGAPAQPSYATLPAPRIEIMLENRRRLSVSDGVDAGFVLKLARGLAA